MSTTYIYMKKVASCALTELELDLESLNFLSCLLVILEITGTGHSSLAYFSVCFSPAIWVESDQACSSMNLLAKLGKWYLRFLKHSTSKPKTWQERLYIFVRPFFPPPNAGVKKKKSIMFASQATVKRNWNCMFLF